MATVLTGIEPDIVGIQKQINVLNQKIDLILAELGKNCQYEPEKYTLVDKEDENEETEDE